MRKKIALLVILVSVAIFVFAGIHIFWWWIDNTKTAEMAAEVVAIAKSDSPDKEDIDFKALEEVNSEVVGWLKVNGTNIDYPYVKTKDNDFYLSHTFDRSESGAGWVFMDYRNDALNWGRNNIIYAHGRQDGTMFGSLKNVLTADWQNNKDNWVVQTIRPMGTNKWQVFSAYVIPTTDDYLRVGFTDDDEFVSFVDKIKKRSTYDFEVGVTARDKILTLSTCYNDAEKVVLHAKLIE